VVKKCFHSPIAEHEAGNSGVCVVENVVTNCPPHSIIAEFQTTFTFCLSAGKTNAYTNKIVFITDAIYAVAE